MYACRDAEQFLRFKWIPVGKNGSDVYHMIGSFSTKKLGRQMSFRVQHPAIIERLRSTGRRRKLRESVEKGSAKVPAQCPRAP